jgi:hypothetical protein
VPVIQSLIDIYQLETMCGVIDAPICCGDHFLHDLLHLIGPLGQLAQIVGAELAVKIEGVIPVRMIP